MQARLLGGLTVSVYGLAIYAISLSPLLVNYRYWGFGTPADTATVVTGLIILFLAGLASPQNIERPSAVVIWAVLLLVFAPAWMLLPSSTLAISTNGTTLVAFTIGYIVLLLSTRIFRRTRSNSKAGLTVPVFGSLILWLTLGMFLIASIAYGFRFRLVSFVDRYTVSSEFAGIAAQSPNTIALYSLVIATSFMVPVAIAWGILHHSKTHVMAGLLVAALGYSLLPQRQLVFEIMLVVFVAFALRRGFRPARLAQVAIFATTFLLVTAAIGHLVSWAVFFNSTLRLIFVPLYTSQLWFEFFAGSPRGNFADTLPFMDSVYTVPLTSVISLQYGTGEGSTNAGIWSDAWANGGIPGVIIVSVFLGLLLAAVDSWSDRPPASISIVLLLATVSTLVNTSLSTTALSGGLLLAVALTSVVPRENAVDLTPNTSNGRNLDSV